MTTVTVAGRINAGEFWKARRAALHAGVKRVEAMPLEPLDYELFLERKRKVRARLRSRRIICAAAPSDDTARCSGCGWS